MKKLFAIACVALLAGCGAGSALPVPVVAPSAQPPSPPALTPTTVSLWIPAVQQTTAASRRPAYISSATNSMVITPPNQAGIVVDLSSAAPGCVTGPSGRTCTVTVSLPVGTYPLAVALFASRDGTGPRLAIASAAQTIALNTANRLSFTLNAVVASLAVSISPNNAFTAGVADTRTINVSVRDAAAATIVVGMDALVDAGGSPVSILLGQNDTSGAVAVSPTVVGANPSTLSYSGGTPNGLNITATARNGSNAVVASVQTTFTVAAAATGPPQYTITRYETTTDHDTLYKQGARMATDGQSGLVILDFGQPWYCDAPSASPTRQGGKLCDSSQVGNSGTFLPSVLRFVTIGDITAAAEAYLDGFYYANKVSTQRLQLAIGTSNFCLTLADCQSVSSDCKSFSFYCHGFDWGKMVANINNYLVTGYRSGESIAAANDIETWNGTANSHTYQAGSNWTKEWLRGYNNATGNAYQFPMYDFGSLDGCQVAGACASSWGPADFYEMSSTGSSYAVAEIYCPNMATQWNQLALWTKANRGVKLRLVGTLTASTLGIPGADKGAPCLPQAYSPQDGFNALQSLLDKDPQGTADRMLYSTDITYSAN